MKNKMISNIKLKHEIIYNNSRKVEKRINEVLILCVIILGEIKKNMIWNCFDTLRVKFFRDIFIYLKKICIIIPNGMINYYYYYITEKQ
jgi:hypothetical protein